MKITSKVFYLVSLCLLWSCSENDENGRIEPGLEEPKGKKIVENKPKKEVVEEPTDKKVEVVEPDKKVDHKVDDLEVSKIVEKQIPYLNVKPLDEITKSWEAIPTRAFPATVKCKVKVAMDQLENGKKVGSLTFGPGRDLKPAKQEGDKIQVVSPSNQNLVGYVAIDDTDLKQQIQKRYDDFVSDNKAKVDLKRADAKKIILAKQKEASSEAQPITLASIIGRGEKISENDPRLAPVKNSIDAGVLTIKLSDVTDYFWNGTETLDGAHSGSFETVNVKSKSSTLFGVFENEYKCVLKGNQVVGWVDPVTGSAVNK